MSVREYIGARYVPVFADPLAWDSTKTYEPLTVVSYQGNSFTSRQAVPAGIDITNETYWAQTGNYNAQIEQYRQEVQAFDGRIDALEDALPIADFTSVNTVEAAIQAEATARQTLAGRVTTAEASITTAEGNIEELFNKSLNENSNMLVIGDSFLQHTNPSWGKMLADLVGTSNYHIYGVSGSGYSSNTKFSTIVGTAYGDLSSVASDITAIVIGGGINDARNQKSYNEVYGDAVNCFSLMHTYFPNAVIFVFPLLLGNRGYGNLVERCNKAITDAAKQVGRSTNELDIRVYSGCWTWLYDADDTVDSDHIHPVTKGQSIIAYSMLNCINGGDSTIRYAETPVKNISGTEIGTAHRRDGFISFAFSGTQFTTAVVSGANVAFWIDQRYYADKTAEFVYDAQTGGNVLLTDPANGNGGNYLFAYSRSASAEWFDVNSPINDDYFIIHN